MPPLEARAAAWAVAELPPKLPADIRQALHEGCRSLTVTSDEPHRELDSEQREGMTGKQRRPTIVHINNVFRYRDTDTGRITVTSDFLDAHVWGLEPPGLQLSAPGHA